MFLIFCLVYQNFRPSYPVNEAAYDTCTGCLRPQELGESILKEAIFGVLTAATLPKILLYTRRLRGKFSVIDNVIHTVRP